MPSLPHLHARGLMSEGVRLLNIIALCDSLGGADGFRAADHIRSAYVKLLWIEGGLCEGDARVPKKITF